MEMFHNLTTLVLCKASHKSHLKTSSITSGVDCPRQKGNQDRHTRWIIFHSDLPEPFDFMSLKLLVNLDKNLLFISKSG